MTTDRSVTADGTEQCACPVCGPFPFQILGDSDGLRLVTCDSCGLVFVNPRLSDAARRKHFASAYIPSIEVLQRSFESRRDLALNRIAAAVNDTAAAGGSILDVGCAGGAFLAKLRDQKWQRFGVEPSVVASDHARQLLGSPVFNGDLMQAQFPAGKFDVVTLLDTLIVVPDPKAVLLECHRILADGGVLVVELPGYNFRMFKSTGLMARLMGSSVRSLNPKELLYHFPDRSIRKLLASCGFDEIRMFPSAPSIYGGTLRATTLRALDWFTLALYRLSLGSINFLPKYVYAARKRRQS